MPKQKILNKIDVKKINYTKKKKKKKKERKKGM